MKDSTIFSLCTQVFSYDSDMEHRMKMSSLLKAVQIIAGKHLDEFGMTIENLTKNNSLFVLVKASVNIFRTPMQDEFLTLKTWTRALDGIVFVRDTVVEDSDGIAVAECSANWVLIDPIKRGILRPEVLNYNIQFYPELALTETRTGRLRTPKDMIEVGKKHVEYTDCDFMGHMNNTNYADIVTNFLPEGMVKQNFVKLDITYSAEARYGEDITVYRKEENGVIWFRGEHARGKCFEAMAELQ